MIGSTSLVVSGFDDLGIISFRLFSSKSQYLRIIEFLLPDVNDNMGVEDQC
jgi:predicted RNA binding protein with dsRBD fold (UPF0201 family)